MKRCNKIEKMILNGNLELDVTVETNETINTHLQDCDDCIVFINELKRVSYETKKLEKLKVSDGFDYNLKRKLDAVRRENQKVENKTIPLFTRIVYYSAGIAAMIIGFFYISSLGIFENNGNTVNPPFTAKTQFVAVDQENKIQTTVADSLENMKKNVSDNNDLRHKVSVGE